MSARGPRVEVHNHTSLGTNFFFLLILTGNKEYRLYRSTFVILRL